MKTILTILALSVYLVSLAAGDCKYRINRITRVDDYGESFRTDSLFYRYTIVGDGSHVLYWYGYPDTTGTESTAAPIRRQANITLPITWDQMHPDSIRNKIIDQLNLTLKP